MARKLRVKTDFGNPKALRVTNIDQQVAPETPHTVLIIDHGSMFIEGNSTPIALAAGISEIITGWTDGGVEAGTTDEDATVSSIRTGGAGVYQISFAASFLINSQPSDVSFFPDNQGVPIPGVIVEQVVTGPGAETASFLALVSLGAARTISVHLESSTTASVTMQDAQLTLLRVS